MKNRMSPFIQYRGILEKYLSNFTIRSLEEAWNEPRRKYHNVDHLQQILRDIEKKRSLVLPIHREALILAAFFHDAVYIPGFKDNEDKSLQMFMQTFKGEDPFMAKKIGEMIECTKYRKKPVDPLLKIFWDADNAGFVGPYEKFFETEKKIRLEFNHLSLSTYKKGRLSFLKSCLGIMGSKADENIKKLMDYIEKNY